MLGFIKKSLSKTVEAVKSVAPQKRVKILKSDLEDILIECDISYDLVERIMDDLPKEVKKEHIQNKLLECFEDQKEFDNSNTSISLIIGVNGAGKTTTIAKLANLHKQKGKSVLLCAADTFRAAAIEQLSLWAKKIDAIIIKSKQGHDPSAIVYDGIMSAKAKGINETLIDTAGRLHNKENLANELKKIVKVAQKALDKDGKNNILKKIVVIDGTQGNSNISSVRAFHDMVGVDELIITKLDGSAKGGAIFSIADELKLPISYVGVGEGIDDLVEFDKNEFISSILDEMYKEEDE